MKRVLGICVLLLTLTLLPAAGALGSLPSNGTIPSGGDTFDLPPAGTDTGPGDEDEGPGTIPGDPDSVGDGERGTSGVFGGGDDPGQIEDATLWKQLMNWLLDVLASP